jgi:hypothetical protein
VACSGSELTSKIMNPFRHSGGTALMGVGPSQDLNLQRRVQHTETWAYVDSLSGIRTHDPSVRPVQNPYAP